MADIRYVCISDTHFGEEDSVLTNLRTASRAVDPTTPSPVMRDLVACLRDLLSHNTKRAKPTLILNGDIFELGLAGMHQALMVFEQFLALALPARGALFDRVVFVPGNHDHHFWEVAREHQYAQHIQRLKPTEPLPAPWHCTNALTGTVQAPLLNQLLQARLPHLKTKGFEVEVAYPNFALRTKNGRRLAVFHHGHFIEPIYRVMSTLLAFVFPDHPEPQMPWDVEEENSAWIDFMWSTLGCSGRVGSDIERIYEKIGDADQRAHLIERTAATLAAKHDLPGWGDRMEAGIVRGALNAVFDSIGALERRDDSPGLSKASDRGLKWYTEGPLRRQLEAELAGVTPVEATMIFGHTHKPFSKDMQFRGFPDQVNTYNTGGWVVESGKATPTHGGAVVLLDEDLDAVSLRMYNEHPDPSQYAVRVEQARHDGEPATAFFTRVNAAVNPSSPPWTTFSDSVARAVSVRAEHLRARINRRD